MVAPPYPTQLSAEEKFCPRDSACRAFSPRPANERTPIHICTSFNNEDPLDSGLRISEDKKAFCSSAGQQERDNAICKRKLHDGALCLLAAVNIPLFILFPQSHTLPPHHSFDSQVLLSSAMPPPQLLYNTTVRLFKANGPFPSTYFYISVLFRKMEFREENLGGRFFRCRCSGIQGEREGTVSKIKAV